LSAADLSSRHSIGLRILHRKDALLRALVAVRQIGAIRD
jgi:hypothetical protein